MSTAEFIEQVCDVKLFDVQKQYLDFLDNNPEAKIAIHRGSSRMMDIDTFYGVVRVAIESTRKE